MKTTEKPIFQQFHIEGVKNISPNDSYNLLLKDEAVLIDVRTEEETSDQYIPLDNVLYHPMEHIIDRLNSISKDQNIILICPGGIRSTKVANLLNLQGYPKVANVDGGLGKWVEMKLPIEMKPQSHGGGCCGENSSKNTDEPCCNSSNGTNSCC